MAVLEIPVRADFNSYSFLIDLDGSTYQLTFSLNGRANRWSMNIADAEGNPLVEGIRLLNDIILNAQFVNDALPPGDFLIIDVTGEDKVPNKDNLGDDLRLVYSEAS